MDINKLNFQLNRLKEQKEINNKTEATIKYMIENQLHIDTSNVNIFFSLLLKTKKTLNNQDIIFLKKLLNANKSTHERVSIRIKQLKKKNKGTILDVTRILATDTHITTLSDNMISFIINLFD